MRMNNTVATVGISLVLCLLAGCAKKMPECGDQNVQDALNHTLVTSFEAQATELEQKYYDRMGMYKNILYQKTPRVNYKQTLSGFASQKQQKDVGKNYCAAVNKSTLSVDLIYAVDGHYGDDPKQLVQEVAALFQAKGDKARLEGDDTLVISIEMYVPNSIDYSAQYSDSGDELIIKVGKE